MYLIEEVGIEASPIMSNDDFLVEFLNANFIKSCLYSLHNNWEILSPLEEFLGFSGIGIVDEKKSIIPDGLFAGKRLPNLMVVWPSLHEDDNILTAFFSFKVVLKWTSSC